MEYYRKHRPDQLLWGTVMLLVGIGLVTLYSSTYAFAGRFYTEGPLYFFSRQAILAALGFVLFFIFSHINLEGLRGWVLPFVAVSVVLCLLPFAPIVGETKNGASRWVKIGLLPSFQPSELVKLVLPFYLAHIFEKKQNELDSFFSSFLPPALVVVVFFVIIYFQNNFSTAVFLLLNAFIVFFLAGFRKLFLMGTTLVVVPTFVYIILEKEHRIRRFASFFSPNPQDRGYQVQASMRTIASGGFWGKGIGHGTRKIASVPEIQSDFIFAGLAEEAGFIGVILVFALFAIFAFAAYRSVLRIDDPFKKLLSFGLATSLVSQIMLNIAVVVRAFPVTGVPLPFFSAGGSSLVITLIMAGILVNNSRYTGSPRRFAMEDAVHV